MAATFTDVAPRSVTAVAENSDSPVVAQYNLDLEQQLPKNVILEVAYVGTRGTRLSESRNINLAALASPTNPINGVTSNSTASSNVQARVPYQGFTATGVNLIETYGFAMYNSLQTTVKRQVSHGFYLQGAYTWSKGLTTVLRGRWNQRSFRRWQRKQQQPEHSLAALRSGGVRPHQSPCGRLYV